MSDFLKRFLLDDLRRFSSNGRFVALAAFGKHPGWDDHVEDLGLETESLNLAKTCLYVNGIGGQIDTGAWEKLDAAQQFPSFKHVFLWQRSGQILVGRMWSSSDGKGRKRYPMVVCMHFTGVPLGWVLDRALPLLAELELECLRAASAEEVRALLSRQRVALREALPSADAKSEYAPMSPESLRGILNSSSQSNPEEFLRVLYQVQSQLRGFAPGTFNPRSNPASVRVQQIRVPLAATGTEQALLFWTRFFRVFVDHSAPLLLMVPLEADWIDVTVGEPKSQEMFCLRATPRAVPKVSEVPYQLDEDFRLRGAAFFESFQCGQTTPGDLKAQFAKAVGAPVPGKSRWFKWLGMGMSLAIGANAAILLAPKYLTAHAPLNSVTPPGTLSSNTSPTSYDQH